MTQTLIERRKSPRITSYLPVCMRMERSGRYVETLTKDVGVGGLRCLVEECPNVNEDLVVELPLFKEVTPIQTHARVAWVQSIIPQGQCVVGLSFDGLSPAHRQALTHYLEHLPAAQAQTHAPLSR